jgi:RNA polymerase sigma factor (sigma-70 family)
MVGRFDIPKEKELIAKAQAGDIAARKQLHQIYKGMLDSIVYQNFRNSPQPYIAIRAQAERLLDQALDRYNPTMANKPTTYFHGYVENKLQRYVNDHANPVRITEQYAWKVGKFKDSMSELTQQLGRKPTDIELERFMAKKYSPHEFNLKTINRLKNDVRVTSFASSVVGRQDEGTPLTMGDLVFTSNRDPMEEYMLDVKTKMLLDKVDTLGEPHKTIILHYFGLKGYSKLSLRDLSAKLGINKYRVQKYLNEGLEKIKDV